MDPLSLAAGVAGLVALSIEIIKILRSYSEGFSQRQKSIRELSLELNSLYTVLEQLENFLRNEDLKGHSFSQSSVLFNANSHCKHLLLSLHSKLNRPAGSNMMLLTKKKLKWPFEEKEIKETIQMLRGYTQTFQLSLTIDGCALLSKTSIYVSQSLQGQTKTLQEVSQLSGLFSSLSITNQNIVDVTGQINNILNCIGLISDTSSCISHTLNTRFDRIERQLTDSANGRLDEKKVEERQKITSWLSPLHFNERHLSIARKRQPGTGNWFLETQGFTSWLNAEIGSTLWCPGIPGAGKSIITSLVVDTLCHFRNMEDVGIAYIYCDYKDPGQTLINLISSLTQQLVSQLSNLPQEVIEFFEEHTKLQPPKPVSLPACSTLFGKISRKFNKCIIIIDALDECVFETRSNILNILRDAGALHLLVTSRALQDIQQAFDQCSRLEITAHDDDLQRYITSRIADSRSLTNFVQIHPDLAADIVSQVTKNSGGMFLFAYLQMEHLSNQTSPRDLRRALQHMTGELVKAYDDCLERIHRQCKEHAELGIRVLSWIYHAQRPFKFTELQHGLSVEDGDDCIDPLGLISAEIIVGVTGGLVIIESENDSVRLVHYSVQEYLNTEHSRWFPKAGIDLAKSCLIYLSFTTFDQGPTKDFASYTQRVQENPFFCYAALHWAEHTRGDAEVELLENILHFLFAPAKLNSSFQTMAMAAKGMDQRSFEAYEMSNVSTSALHIAARKGLTTILETLIERNVELDDQDWHGYTALSRAARWGQLQAVSRLLGCGAKDIASDYSCFTTLDNATIGGEIAVVKLLFDEGFEFDQENIVQPAFSGNEDLARFMLEIGWFDDEDLAWALTGAAKNGHACIIRLLIEESAVDINRADINGEFALIAAASSGKLLCVNILLKAGGLVDVATPAGPGWAGLQSARTALHVSAGRGFDDIVETLLRHNANVDAEDLEQSTPLHLAITNRHYTTVRILLEAKASTTKKDCEGDDALDIAKQVGDQEVIELIETGRLRDSEMGMIMTTGGTTRCRKRRLSFFLST